MKKPYVDQLFSPAGVQVLRDSPHDHKHHHGLMYAVSVDGVNFWEEASRSSEREKHRSLKEVDGGVPRRHLRVGFAEELDWMGPATDKPLLVERREIDVLETGGSRSAAGLGATLVDWRCRFAVPEGKDSAVIERHALQRPGDAIRAVDGQGRPVLQRRRQAGRRRSRIAG